MTAAATNASEPDQEPDEHPLAPPPRSSASGIVLATLAVIAALWWGKSFAIPLTAGLMLAMLVAPLVIAMQRAVRSRLAATVTALLVVMATLTAAGYAFGGQLLRVTERVPEMISLAAERLAKADPVTDSVLTRARNSLRELDRSAGRLMRGNTSRPTRREAAGQAAVLAAASMASAPSTFSDGANVVLRETAVTGSGMLVKFASDLTIILFIAFFVLAGGNQLSERLIDQWGHHPVARRRAASALRECARQVRLYAGVLLVTNAIIGLGIWLAFSYAGLPDAAGWGVTAAVVHVIPYLGMTVLTMLGAAETFLAHGTPGSAIGMSLYIVALSTLIGTVVTAWMQGRAAKMNPAAVFIGLVFWGAMWGLWGLFLGPALVVCVKVVAEYSRSGKRLALLLKG
jgi:predicted PurR-regulated permease PerM